jgi:hypothetical protein
LEKTRVYDSCPTVKVKHDESPGGYFVINESDFDAAVHVKYDEPAPLPPVPGPLPPPPGPVDPLADLGADWKNKDAAELKKLAEVVSGGRAVENKRQAVEVIEAALKARGA